MAKRRLISLLPSYQQTDDLRNFFGSTVDQVFQPGRSQPVSGYIGRRSGTDTHDFYVGEPTTSRAAYQLESAMVSYDAVGDLAEVLSYPDFIGYLETNGADVKDHQRLFETEYYSWCPPCNIDMLVNYRNYYWFGDDVGAVDLPILVLRIPFSRKQADGHTQTFALPVSIKAIAVADEAPAVYVNNLPVDFRVVDDTVELAVTPAFGSDVLIARVPDFAAAISDLTTSIDISDLNTHDVSVLTSGMRIQIIDLVHIIGAWDAQPWDYNLWDLSGSRVYMVDGVGQGIRLIFDEDLLHGIKPQYVTIDRTSRDNNLWSLHNLWVHKDSFAWSEAAFLIPLTERQAKRPIIEFVRDLVLWRQVEHLQTSAYIGGTVLTFDRELPNLVGRRVTGQNIARNTVVQSVNRTTVILSQPLTGNITDATDITFTQVWSESDDPLFMLYDLSDVALNDVRYPNSTFVGSKIFSYSLSTTNTFDPVLLRRLAFDQIHYILFDNLTVTERYSYLVGAITGLYAYATHDTAMVYESLWHAVATTTSQSIRNGFYDVPLNLQANPASEDVHTISRSTWIDHFRTLIDRQVGIVGQSLGVNNYRDTARDLTLGRNILQHRAPLLKAMLLASNTIFDLPQAIRFVDQEYNRFRNKFARKIVELSNDGTLSEADPATVWVTTTLKAIKRDKNNKFPFALNTIAGDRYFIPPSPTCLGILPAARPAMVIDTTYAMPVQMILGHDGSFTPAFDDWRDPIMLALEQMIFDNLPTSFQTEARPGFDIQQWIGGRFYQPYNGYTRDEVSNMLAPWFELWAQQNRFDYRTNVGFDQSNPFTWNYRGVLDRSGNSLPGNWRAIYRWYYGTDAPHLRPWEMFGFVSEPVWWQATYGMAPYGRTHPLWYDLETGKIPSGIRVGTSETYRRPGLIDYIPVDADGNLLDPVAAGIVDGDVTSDTAARSWLAGDHGPVENLWINSPSYRFALAMIGFLMKPARFVEQCWEPLQIGYKDLQWVDLTSFERPQNSHLYLHGETVDGKIRQVIGISQWIDDYLVSSGHTSDALGGFVRGLGVKLVHQMAGFTSDDESMKVIADNFGLVPAEDINSALYTSPSTRTEVYSGVILEWTGRSWRAIGYDARNPYFTIIKPDVNGPKGLISLADAAEPSIVKWHTNTYYPIGILADHLNSVWECIRSHTSITVFEQTFWVSRPDLSLNMVRAPRVITYLNGTATVRVSYGTELLSYQEVADFLLGWQRWLQSRGWIFDTIDDQTGQIRNWSLSVREFLSWAQVQWSPGNFIALSPGQQQLKFSTPHGTILNVENATNGFFGLIDRSGRPIRQRDSIINRLDGDITILAKQADIFAARLGLADVEHALIFNNVTIFDDKIYLPLYNQRQARLRLNCKRSTDWTGRMDAPGFVIMGNELASDFEKAAEDIRLMFDIENSDDTNLRDYARHVIGFQRRDYLENLLISDVEQFEFYQGMIQQKGAPGVFEKLTRSIRASNNSNLQFLEEWAVRISDYGAPFDPFMIFQLRQTDLRDHPQIVRLIPTPDAPLTWVVFSPLDSRWVDRPASTEFFTLRTDYAPPMLPTAGPVRLSDVNATAFYITDVPALYITALQADQIPFPTGFLTWVYERADGTYTVLRSFETGVTPNAILTVVTAHENVTVETTRIIFQRPITLTPADVGAYLVIHGLSLSNPELEGLVIISDVNVAGNWVDLEVVSAVGHDFAAEPDKAPFVRVLREVRFADRAAVKASGYAFAVNDLVWIDADEALPTITVSDAKLDAYWGTWHEFMADLDGGDEVMGSQVPAASPSPQMASFAIKPVTQRWAVLRWDGMIWETVRNQPKRVDSSTITETVIYHAGTKVVDLQMIIDEPVVDEVIVIDPLNDLIAGIAEREIEYEVGYDPARYNAGAIASGNPWGPNEVGQVWWDLTTVKFLDPYTDILEASSERDIAELTYRCAHWGHIAPGSSVDVYEWIESSVDPTSYRGPGTVYNKDNPAWAEHSVYSIQFGRDITRFYFWVKGLTVKPELSFRHTDITTVAMAIENPSGLDLSWMAAISQDALIVSGIAQFLDDTSTVMKVKLTLDPESASRHDEWQLLRPTDQTSLPPALIWQKLRDSLAGFDINGQPVPDPSLNAMRAVGIRPSQSMFAVDQDGPRRGLLAARQSFVGIVNTILNRAPIWRYRGVIIDTLYHSTPMPSPILNPTTGLKEPPPLAWSQDSQSEVFEPPPSNEWDVQVYSLVQRNRLLGRADFEKALTTGKRWRVLLNGIGQPRKQWSIWEFDTTAANTLIANNPDEPVDKLLIKNADAVFRLATAYDLVVEDREKRNNLSSGGYGIGPYGIGTYAGGGTVTIGQRVLVEADTNGFWSIWKYLPSDATADAHGFVLWRVQSYRTNDFLETIDWYAAGYSASTPPIVIYDSITERNSIEGMSPSNQFVKVLDDGSTPSRWIWTQFDVAANQWKVVAMQNGTAKLTDDFYNPDHLIHAVDIWRPLVASAALGVRTLTFADTSGFAVGQFIHGPGLDRNTKIAAIETTTVTLDMATVAVIPRDTKLTISNLSVTDITVRDGSWEIYVLADALRYGEFLTDAEVNEIFFSILHFVHTQNDSVDWAFKTSFMAIVGYNVPLTQTPVLLSDQTDSLVSYINEVKPYHVKVRGFSTQYNTDVDDADTHLIEDPVFDVTLLFDRYTHSVDGWDMESWDVLLWDGGETSASAGFVHTVVVKTLLEDGPALQVDDVRFFLNVFDTDDRSQPVSKDNPLTVRINTHVYSVIEIEPDEVNISSVLKTVEFVAAANISATILTVDAIISGTVVVGQILTGGNIVSGTTIINALGNETYTVSVAQTVSTTILQGRLITQQGLSGRLITGAVFRVADGTQGTIVEAIIVTPNAANRITQHYQPSETMPDDDLSVLLSLDPRPSFEVFTVTASAKQSTSVLTLAHTEHISVHQPVFGPNIINGTTVTAVDASTITLSHPISNDLLKGGSITVGLPTHIAGDMLYTNEPFYNYDGNALAIDLSLNPAQASRPGGFDLRSPYHTANHPEERLPFNGDDAFQISVNALPIAGAPPQVNKAFNVSTLTTSTATLYFDLLAQSAAAVMVFRDGVRALAGRDYTVDHFARTITVQLLIGTGRVKRVAVHAFGLGGISAVTEAFYLAYATNPFSITAATNKANVDMVIDGTRLAPADFTINDTLVSLKSPPAVGTDMAIVFYKQGVKTGTLISVQKLLYEISSVWSLVPNDTITVPEHAGTIVELNGRRLTPPYTFYGNFTKTQNWMDLWVMPTETTTYTVYVDGVKYTTPIPIADPATLPPGTPPNVKGRFVFFDNKMIALDPKFTANTVAVVLNDIGFPADYTMSNGQLTVNVPVSPSDDLVATVFSNAGTMAIKTVVYAIDVSTYPIPFTMIPTDRQYTLVSMNGLTLVPDLDYQLRYFDDGTAVIDLLIKRTTGYLVVTCFTGKLAHPTQQWLNVSRTPAMTRMPVDASGDYHVLDECLGLSPSMAGKLTTALAPGDTEISLQLFLRQMSPKLLPATPLDIPRALPGAIWLGSERIEYFRLSRVGDMVTLGGLRRATRGTSISEQRQVITTTGDGRTHNYNLNSVGAVEVMVDNVRHDFTSQVVGSNTTVAVAAPVGSFVTISMTTGYVYPSGTAAYNGTKIACDPPRRLSPSLVVAAPPPGVMALGLAGRPIASWSKIATLTGTRTGKAGITKRRPVPNGVRGTGIVGLAKASGAKPDGVVTIGQVGTAVIAPTLALNFMTPGALDSRIVFSRASTATYHDSNGVIQTAASNAPRWDYDPATKVLRGLLLEDARTNLALNSGTLSGWGVTNLTAVANTGVAPDGTTTMTRFVETTANGSHMFWQGTTSIGGTAIYTCSLFAKAAEVRYLQLSFDEGAGAHGFQATFDLQNGVVSGAGAIRGTGIFQYARINAIGNGIYRCSITGSIGTGTNGRFLMALAQIAAPTFAQGYVGNAANGLLAWGAQIEFSSFTTSYIPTVGTIVTRSADACSVPVDSVWYDATQGSMSIEYILEGATATFNAPAQFVGASSQLDYISVDEQTTQTAGIPSLGTSSVVVSGSAVAYAQFQTSPGVPIPLRVVHRGAASWALNNAVRASHDGFTALTQVNTCTSLPVIVNLTIAGPMHFQAQICLWARSFNYWPRGLSTTEMLTASTLDPLTLSFMAP